MYVYVKYVYIKQLKSGTNNFLYQQLLKTDEVAVGGRSRVPKRKISLNCTKLNNQSRQC